MTRIVIVGAGPAGLMAAEQLAGQGWQVDVYEQMPTAGRKLLRAGIGGLNITHSENHADFIARYSRGRDWLLPHLEQFGSAQVVDFFHQLGIETFVGSSGRVFPVEKKAAPFLRRWLSRLRDRGVRFHFRQRWLGLEQGLSGECCLFEAAGGQRQSVAFDLCILALGGGSWPELGSDGRWLAWAQAAGVDCSPFVASNMGFVASSLDRQQWSAPLRACAGQPLKQVRFTWGAQQSAIGECTLTEYGLEGSLVYQCSSFWREHLSHEPLPVSLDLLPQLSCEQVQQRLAKPRQKQSFSQFVRRQLKLEGVKLKLLYELVPDAASLPLELLAAVIKALPLLVRAPAPLAKAISTAGGVTLGAVNEDLSLRERPDVYVCGEMLDWDAPTGGYLLTACFATGASAGRAVARRLQELPC